MINNSFFNFFCNLKTPNQDDIKKMSFETEKEIGKKKIFLNLKLSKNVMDEKKSEDFLKDVNDILKDINLSIKLKIEGNDYYLETTLLNNDELTVDDISEGEKNLLSLIFFYFEISW